MNEGTKVEVMLMGGEKEKGAGAGYLATVCDLGRGAALNELDEGLAAVVRGALEQQKAGELTFTLKVKPASKGNSAMLIEYSLKVKAPQPARPQSILFADDDGALSRMDPKQTVVPNEQLRVPTEPSAPAPVRQVADLPENVRQIGGRVPA